MATKRSIELHAMAVEDIKGQLNNAVDNYRKLKFDHAIQGLGNPLELRSLRKEIARLQTEIRSRELAEMSKEQLARRNRIIRRRK
ncbi:MAG TPA: 50S ribosomal protein L29 [Saprospiraceae bacterium]|nr:50S ribosomal protein L29 [Saprospiraceae bacterium]MCB9329216.1 50S ribosomal protein L29 [Lewinellaceae bacterium]HPK09686.1 50S ribosomal protein L29 [Saprospiraceae bacterium]HPQ20693.1 50S ribosomal protein L29 [Saprospiraceae bacterium]